MKVSVVVAIYNSEGYIRSCLDVLNSQTFRDFETILVVDARSKDGSVALCESLITQYPRVSMIVQTDDGRAGGARNLGMDQSTGEYIWFLDVDDLAPSSFLEEMVKIGEDNDANIVVSNFFYSKKKVLIEPLDKEYKIVEHDNNKAMLELNDGKYSTNLFNKLFKTEYLRSNNIRMTTKYCEDYEFLRDCFEHHCQVIYYNKPLYTYVLSEGTRSSGEGNRIAKEDIRIFEETILWADENYTGNIKELYTAGLTHILRSLTNTDKNCFDKLIKKDIVKRASNIAGWSSKEIILFKISKTLFYRTGIKMRDKKFSNDCFIFDNDV